ncbi:MAG TPA: putative Ig domain-containing protein, partial [Pirellulales bacterium]|nr:putative Ig domain-containing protein [Pirellulales bacterium]
PLTFSFPGLPSWLAFDPNNYDLYGTPPLGAANGSPYQLDIHATNGLSSADLPFELDVSGVQFGAFQSLRYNTVGSTVDFSVPATTSTGHPLTFSASGLPDGISINPATGEITGTLASSITQPTPYQISVSASDGLSSESTDFSWNVVPANYTDGLSLVSPGPLTSQVGQTVYAYVPGNSSFLLRFNYSVSGLPAGFSLGAGYISGEFTPDDVTGSPYHVTVTINDGFNTASTTFDWLATPAGAITLQSPFPQTNNVGNSVIVGISANTTSGLPLSYSATGLPTGLSINSQTGLITGKVANLSAIPGHFNPIVTVTDGVNTASTRFQWTIDYVSIPNIVQLALPDGGTIELDGASGTEVTAAVHLSPDVGPPGSIQFPFGFITFSVQASVYAYGATPIGTTNLAMTIHGPGSSAVNNDYEYGPTPANPTPHWYSFIAGHQTDSDSASNTGLEVVGGGTFYRIFVDGARGDDDLTKNGIISGVGGLAITTTGTDPYTVSNTNDSGAGSLRQAILNANAAAGVIHSITFALPSGPQTINLQSPLPAMADPMIAVADATQNVTILSSGGATDSFAAVVKTGDGTLAFGEISHVGGSLQVSGGLLRLLGQGAPSFAVGTSATVSGTGTLELAGAVSALDANVNVSNSSTATAGIVVSGQNQIVGAIDGTGNFAVSDGGSVTVSHITAGSLVIGNGGMFTVAASDAHGNPVAQSASATVVATGAASASSPTAQDSGAGSSARAAMPNVAASLPARSPASLLVRENGQSPAFSGDWFAKRPLSENLSARASPRTDDGLPPDIRKSAAAVVAIQSELVDAVFENRWATASGESHSTENSWSDSADDELVRTLAAELTPWGVVARKP